jgi:hypothetical protein
MLRRKPLGKLLRLNEGRKSAQTAGQKLSTDATEDTSFTDKENALVKNNAGLQIVDVETGLLSRRT